MTKQKKTSKKEKPVFKKNEVKRHLINPRYKNTVWTIIFFIVLTIFFIVNNTKSVPDRGPYPPNYNSAKGEIKSQPVDPRVDLIKKSSDTLNNK